MTIMLAVLALWGMMVSLDLVSWPQVMIARPLVAGTVAGWIVGDVVAGATVGVVLELFALEVLPVGASRYPDYGVAAVAAAYAAADAPGVMGQGTAVLLGLAVAFVGQGSIHLVRRWTARDLRRHATELEAGDAAAIRVLHLRGVGRDALRGLGVSVLGLLAAAGLRQGPLVGVRGLVLLEAAAVGCALGVGMLGALRLSARQPGRAWLAAGLVVGALWMALR